MTPHHAPLIQARGLTKRFGGFTAVDGIDVEVQPGEVFGFLGPNGAGKSSTMRMIGCVSPPTSGSLSVLGLDPAADGPVIRGRMGVVPQRDTLDEELTVRENILVYGRYFGLPKRVVSDRATELLEFAQLSERAEDRVEPLSGGMKRRLTIARALVNEPELLLLDEPTTGLDPQARHVLWDRLFRLKRQGATLVLTTHYMDEAEQLCDRLVVMDGGRIVEDADPALQPLACPDERGPEEALANRLRTRIRTLMAERGADLAYGRTLPRLLRESDLIDVGAEAYFPIVSRACAVLEAATVQHVRDQLLAAELATPEEIETHLANLAHGDLDLMFAPMITAWARKPAPYHRPLGAP